MNINTANRTYPYTQTHALKSKPKEQVFIDTLKEASQKPVSKQDKRRITGRWALVPTGFNTAKVISIRHAEDSTPEDPIMCTKDGNDRVHINNVNPSHATELEMQMYCAYLDETGRGTGSTFGTYSDLKTVLMASRYSKGGGPNASRISTEYELKKNTQHNWIAMTQKYMDIVKLKDKMQYDNLKCIYDEIQNKMQDIKGYKKKKA